MDKCIIALLTFYSFFPVVIFFLFSTLKTHGITIITSLPLSLQNKSQRFSSYSYQQSTSQTLPLNDPLGSTRTMRTLISKVLSTRFWLSSTKFRARIPENVDGLDKSLKLIQNHHHHPNSYLGPTRSCSSSPLLGYPSSAGTMICAMLPSGKYCTASSRALTTDPEPTTHRRKSASVASKAPPLT